MFYVNFCFFFRDFRVLGFFYFKLLSLMLPWSLEHRVFAYDAYVKNGESVTETQRLFKRRFNIGRHGNVPSRNSILRWVNALRTTGSLLKAKPPGPVRSARTSENVDRVREAITRSPRRSARRHSTELGISQSTMQRILHKDLVFQPYKIMTLQQLNPRDYQQRLSFLPNNARHNQSLVSLATYSQSRLNSFQTVKTLFLHCFT